MVFREDQKGRGLQGRRKKLERKLKSSYVGIWRQDYCQWNKSLQSNGEKYLSKKK